MRKGRTTAAADVISRAASTIKSAVVGAMDVQLKEEEEDHA